ncbi:MAG: hypothetical protein ACI8RD_003623, partial [Bacillariaceae sp.]
RRCHQACVEISIRAEFDVINNKSTKRRRHDVVSLNSLCWYPLYRL